MPARDEPELNPCACLLLAVTVALIGVTAESVRVPPPSPSATQRKADVTSSAAMLLINGIFSLALMFHAFAPSPPP
jgi:hypothetical protein